MVTPVGYTVSNGCLTIHDNDLELDDESVNEMLRNISDEDKKEITKVVMSCLSEITKIPEALAGFSSLTHLDMSYSGIKSTENTPEKLDRLDLSNCGSLESLKGLQGKQIDELNLNNDASLLADQFPHLLEAERIGKLLIYNNVEAFRSTNFTDGLLGESCCVKGLKFSEEQKVRRRDPSAEAVDKLKERFSKEEESKVSE